MIYYNLESEYPGDFTKHCGLTIAEADGNFYELERMIMDMKKSEFGPTLFYASAGDKNSTSEFGIPLQVETVDSSTFVINGDVPCFSLDMPYHACVFIFENPFFSGFVKTFGGFSVFINNTPVYDITKDMMHDHYALIPDIFFYCLMESDGDEYIMNFAVFDEDSYAVGDNIIDSKENQYPIPVTPIPTVNKSFNIRVEKQGVVVCDCKVIFGEDFHLLPVPGEIEYTEIVPDTEICTPGTVIDAEHQVLNINSHFIKTSVVVDFCSAIDGEEVLFDFPQSFDFGFSIVGLDNGGTWDEPLMELYPDAEYSIYIENNETEKTVTPIHSGMFWDDLSVCDNYPNFNITFSIVVDRIILKSFIGYDHPIYLDIMDKRFSIGNTSQFSDSSYSLSDSMIFEIRWDDDRIEKYYFNFICIEGKTCGK